MDETVIQAAAPSGIAAYLINGKTLQSILYLPVGTSKCLPLHSGRMKGMHNTFSNVGILFIDEKIMVGQKQFTMVSKRLQEARPHYKYKSFGNRSVVLLGDFEQLSPVCDSLLFKANAFHPSGHNIDSPQHIPAFLTRPSHSPKLFDNKEHIKHTSRPNRRAWVKVYLRKTTGGAGGVDISTCFQRRQSSCEMTSLHVYFCLS